MVEYLGADLDEGGREFVPTAELVAALDVSRPRSAGRWASSAAAPPRRILTEDGTSRQARGYLIADIRTAIEEALRRRSEPDSGPA